MMMLKQVAVILIVFIWAHESLAGCHRSRRSSNEYILHRCTATAELIRKHRNGEGVSSRKTEDDSSSRLQIQQREPEIFAATILADASQSETPSGVYRRMTHMRRRGSGHARRITSKHLADTPLRTVNIDVPQGRPSAFKKKNPLPELANDVSGRKIDSSPRVIIIKPVT